MKIRTALQEPGPLKRPNVLRKKNRIAHSLEERQAVTFFGRETGRHIFRKKDETKHSPEEGKDDKKNVSREEAAVRKKILTGLLCLAIPQRQMLPDPPLHLPQSSQTFLRKKKAMQKNRHNRHR